MVDDNKRKDDFNLDFVLFVVESSSSTELAGQVAGISGRKPFLANYS